MEAKNEKHEDRLVRPIGEGHGEGHEEDEKEMKLVMLDGKLYEVHPKKGGKILLTPTKFSLRPEVEGVRVPRINNGFGKKSNAK